jgi:hypothetical protein
MSNTGRAQRTISRGKTSQRSFVAEQLAREAAIAIGQAIADPGSAGDATVVHLLLARPRRGTWIKAWTNLPGLKYDCGARCYSHELLPGWQYTGAELLIEMIPDLEHFAATGEQPKEATR